jgi:hypothetical protein
VYAAISKLLEFSHFGQEMHNQIFGFSEATIITYTLPPFELFTACLLLFESSRNAGLYISLLLLIVFTGYIFLVTIHFFTRGPCSCGGILEHMGWTTHLYFNITYLALTLTAIFINKKGDAVTRRNEN